MATLAQRKQKRKAKSAERRSITLANAVAPVRQSVGHSMPVPNPPNFGPPRYTPEQQAANPGEPMTRVVKDLCRAGSWKSGFGPDGQTTFEEFDQPALQQIVRNANALMQSGHAINIGKGHGDEDLAIHADDLIAPLDAVLLHNGVMWGSAYVTPLQAEYLRNPARKVSLGLWRNYESGDGQVYPGLSALHVAVPSLVVAVIVGLLIGINYPMDVKCVVGDPICGLRIGLRVKKRWAACLL